MIAFLGWGSLIWDPRDLPVDGDWRPDGPEVQVEFLRQSKDGDLTLVISETVAPVRSFWAIHSGSCLTSAHEALCDRERVPRKNMSGSIGGWSRGDGEPKGIRGMEVWAASHGIESVVWTALPPKFNGVNGTAPTIEEALSYLSGLTGMDRERAENYVRRAPQQINTAYRRRIEATLGWSFRA